MLSCAAQIRNRKDGELFACFPLSASVTEISEEKKEAQSPVSSTGFNGRDVGSRVTSDSLEKRPVSPSYTNRTEKNRYLYLLARKSNAMKTKTL